MGGLAEFDFVERAGFRPEQPLGLMAGTSELLAKADFETSAVVDEGADLQSRFFDQSFGGE